MFCVQQLASHGLFDVSVEAEGDVWIDDHHTNEDIALALGTALAEALGDRRGINRFGNFAAPLDEALVHVVLVRSLVVDLSRRRRCRICRDDRTCPSDWRFRRSGSAHTTPSWWSTFSSRSSTRPA